MSIDQPVAVLLMIVFAVIAIAVPLIYMGVQNLWNATGLIAGVIMVGVFVVIFAIGMAMEWRGTPLNGCVAGGDCYCENQPILDQPLAVKQPVGTLTAYFPIFFGLLILGWTEHERIRGLNRLASNPMRNGSFFPILYGLTVIFLGIGSMFYHASMTDLLGAFDPASIMLFATLVIAYDVYRLAKGDTVSWGWWVFLIVWGAVVIGLTVLIFAGGATDLVSMGAIGLAILIETLIWVAQRIADNPTTSASGWVSASRTFLNGLRRPWYWYPLMLVTLGVAIGVWLPSHTGAALCATVSEQFSVWQWHGLWHLLAMGAVPFMFYLMYREESRA
ncbi:MAG: hypothetical protein SF162_16930 [bacterium]|nr:hypothetical protein [bacterium]